MTTQQVDEVARGRVWTGADALRRGLVDELGGLHRAADVARSRAGLPADAVLRPYPHVPLLRQLRRPRSSEDPAAAHVTLPEVHAGVDGVLGALGIGAGTELLMPPVRI
jgi:protease-4